MADTKAFVCGCAGTALSDDERRFLDGSKPWGLILFRRNVGTPDEVRRLCDAFRACVGRDDALVLVDQEGGRVQRLGPPAWPAYPSAATYRSLGDKDRSRDAARLAGSLIASDLRQVGISVDCAPVLDIPSPGSHQVIGNRAFGEDPDTVAQLARAFADGLLAGGVLPVIKHIPGHGRAGVDSHLDLPVVQASREELEAIDFRPFAQMRDLPAGMTAHVVFTAFDEKRPATLSPIVIDTVIRGALGFSGLLLTDDLSMEALKGSIGERAAAASAAGCDILLHCNGKLDEAAAVAAVAPILDGDRADRAARALASIGAPQFQVDAGLRQRFDALLAVEA